MNEPSPIVTLLSNSESVTTKYIYDIYSPEESEDGNTTANKVNMKDTNMASTLR